MMCAVRVTADNGKFRATLVGSPEMTAGGATRDEAVAALRAALDAQASNGEIVWIDVPKATPRRVREPYTPEQSEMMREIVAEIYRERAAEKAREFPE